MKSALAMVGVVALVATTVVVTSGQSSDGAKAVWVTDATKAGIPNAQASGRIDGSPFRVDLAVVKPYWEVSRNIGDPPKKADRVDGVALTLQDGTSNLPSRYITIFAVVKPGEQVDGKTFVLPVGGPFKQTKKIMGKDGQGWFDLIAGIQLHADRAGQPARNDLFPRCSMRLQFGKRRGGRLPGRIYLSFDDSERSFVAGTFNAMIRER